MSKDLDWADVEADAKRMQFEQDAKDPNRAAACLMQTAVAGRAWAKKADS